MSDDRPRSHPQAGVRTTHPEAAPRPRTGDTVKHGPTGETWLVAYYDGRDLVPCGWPCTFARVEDCEVVERATDEEHADLLRRLADMPGNEYDPRRSYARRKLGLT